MAGIGGEAIDHIAIPRKRSAHLAHKALWALRLPHLALGRAPVWRRFGNLRDVLAHCVGVSHASLKAEVHFVEHHVAHAASSFFPSPYEDSAVLSVDGLGDFASMAWGRGTNVLET